MSGNRLNTTMSSILGGGIPGSQPKNGLIGGGANSNSDSGMIGGSERSQTRTVLRQAFGNSALSSNIRSPQAFVSLKISKTTPFRAAMSAGDVNGSVNKAPAPGLPAINQVGSQRVPGTQNISGPPRNNGDAYYTGNPKYVYDGSDFTRYKRLKAINKTYDDSSFGGSNNGAYTFIMHVRRF